MAHFLEHLVFKGGEKYPTYKDVNETAERLGGVLNAYTSHDLVAFHITVRAESARRGDRPAQRLRRAAAAGRRGARPRARRGDPGDQPRLRPALDGRRVPDRPGRLRRAPARAHGAGPRGEPARASRARAIVAFRERRWAGARGGAFLAGNLDHLPAEDELAGALRALSRAARARALPSPRRSSRRETLVEERDTNQSHLRMIYRPADRGRRRARARRAVDLLDAARAARWARGCSRRSARSAASATRCTRSTTPSPTCRSCSSARAWSRPSASRPTRACARSSTSCASDGPDRGGGRSGRAPTPPGAWCSRSRTPNAVARYAANQKIVFGEDIDPDAAIAALDAVTFDEVARGRRGRRARSSRWPASGPHTAEEF